MKARASALLLSLLVAAGCSRGQQAPEPQKFLSNGVNIQYTVEGRGEPVILIHGLSSSGQMNWRAPGTIKELTKSYQVIALDVRGHGGSDKPDQAGAYGVKMVDDVARLMNHLHLEKAHVVGYSMGGMITLKLLALHPERVKSAVLGGMGWLREGSALQDFWSDVPERRGAHTPSACVRSLGELAVTEAQVKAVCVPVAILIGDRDPVRRLYVAPLEAIRPDWLVTVITNAGHLNCIFKAQFKEALNQRLDKQQKNPNSKPQTSDKLQFQTLKPLNTMADREP